MKFIMIGILALFTAIQISGGQKNSTCKFLYLLRTSSNNVIRIKGQFIEFAELAPGDPVLNYLSKNKIIDHKKYGSQIVFVPENCKQKWAAPLEDFKGENRILTKHNLYKEIWLNCKIFKVPDYTLHSDTPFFIVNNVSLVKP